MLARLKYKKQMNTQGKNKTANQKPKLEIEKNKIK